MKPTNPDWTSRLQALETFFQSFTLPTEPIRINKGVTVIDVAKYLDTNLSTARANNGNPYFLPYLERVEALREKLIKEQNG